MKTTIENPQVAAVFEAYPAKIREKLLFLRQLIFEIASKTKGVGELEETLKWGQPSYLTTISKSGSLVRIDQIKTQEGHYALYFHCQTSLVSTFKEIYPQLFKYQGNRAIIFNQNDKIPLKELSHCLELALTYYLHK